MKTLPLFILTLLLALQITAQNGNKREKIKALKVSYISEKLNLSETEAQAFWPIYNTYENNLYELRSQGVRQLKKEVRENYQTLTESRANELLNKLSTFEDRVYKERVTLRNKLKKVLPAKKILRLKTAEEGFNRKILSQYRKQKKRVD